MAGAVNIPVVLPSGESDKVYAPTALALEIRNLQRTNEGTLRTIVGPCPLIPDQGAGYPAEYGNMHGVFHASLDGGMRDVMLIRSGNKLLEQTGWTRGVKVLAGPGGEFSTAALSDEPNAKFPDQFCEVGGKIIWTNGVDTPLCYDGYVMRPLGYSARPHAPQVLGPAAGAVGYSALTDPATDPTPDALLSTGTDARPRNSRMKRNSAGYSHPGRIGTVGDTLLGADGALLAGSWRYYVQFEDVFGNRSPLSAASGVVELRTEQAADTYKPAESVFGPDVVDLGSFAVQTDDLTRQFFVTNIPIGPDGTVARLLFRSPDEKHSDGAPRLVVRIPDNSTTVYADSRSDAELGSAAVDYLQIRSFKVMCPYRGGLAMANTAANPGMLMLSEAGAAGSVRPNRTTFPDPNGGEVTGLATFNGVLYALTASTMYEVVDDAEGLRSRPKSTGVGGEAPSSLRATGFGELVWVSRDGLCRMGPNGAVEVLTEENNSTLFSDGITRALLPHAVAEWCPETQEYLCAVTEAGKERNRLVLAYDGVNVRRQHHGIGYTGMCVTKDRRRLLVACGNGSEDNVFVLNRAVLGYPHQGRTSLFRTNWLRTDPTGRNRFNVVAVYVGFVESDSRTVAWRTHRNGRRTTAGTQNGTLVMRPVDDIGSWSTTEIGAAELQRPRLFWRKFEPDLRDVDSFAFDLEANDGAPLELAGFSFDLVPSDNVGGTVPR